MHKITATDPESKSADLLAANIAKLKELFPEVVAEGKVDFKALQEILGNEVESGEEFYRFTWAGKAQARREAHKPSTGTLRPCPEESVEWDSTKNLYIEGDNLEVLKLLQKSYGGKVKLIYIDPPYNTGTDFVYKDNYHDNLRNYKELTGQVDSEGNTLSTDTDTVGRYHSNWLNMMYPRLKLARNLLADDGAIYVSIDFNEAENLKKIMDDVFGESNFQRSVIWRIGWLSGYKTIADNYIRNHDSMLFYSKSTAHFCFNKKYIQNKDFKPLIKKEPKLLEKLSSLGLSSDAQKELFQFVNHENRPERYPIEDTWNSNEYDDLNSIAIVSFSGEKISKILDIEEEFKGQKSVKMLKRVIDSVATDGDIVMDFFSGTGSTAHAVMQLNAEDGGQRRHIQVQFPEPTDTNGAAHKAGYATIAEIGKERIRRAGKKIVGELTTVVKGLLSKAVRTEEEEQELEDKKERLAKLDIGFRVFKLDSSNINAWDGDPERMQENLLSAAENIKPDRTEADVLYEVLLKYGLDLTLPIEERTIANCTVYNVGMGALFLCLSEHITNAVAEGIGQWKEELKPETCRVIFRDNGFTDVEKTNAVQTLKRYGVTEVRSV